MFTFVTSCCSPHIFTSQQKSSTECLIWCQSGCVRILPFDRLRGLCHSTVSDLQEDTSLKVSGYTFVGIYWINPVKRQIIECFINCQHFMFIVIFCLNLLEDSGGSRIPQSGGANSRKIATNLLLGQNLHQNEKKNSTGDGEGAGRV